MTSNLNAPPTSPRPLPLVRERTEGFDLDVAPEIFLTDAGPAFRSAPIRAAIADVRSNLDTGAATAPDSRTSNSQMNVNNHLPLLRSGPAPAAQPTLSIRFKGTTSVLIDDNEFIIHGRPRRGYVLRRPDLPHVIAITFKHFIELFDAGRLTINHDCDRAERHSGSDLPDIPDECCLYLVEESSSC